MSQQASAYQTLKELAPYFHVLEGRARIKVPAIRRSPATAQRVISVLTALRGIEYVQANTVTGNLLILYDSTTISLDEIAEALHSVGCLQTPAETANRLDRAMEILLQSLAETALERVILALL